MLQLSSTLNTALAGAVLSLSRCYLITRSDGVQLGFTDHDENIVIGLITYQARSGFDATNLSTNTNLSTDNMELNSVLDSALISERELATGKYDLARLDIFDVDWENLPATLILTPPFNFIPRVINATLGRVEMSDRDYKVEATGRTFKLQQKIGSLTSPSCPHDLGNSQCGVNLATYTTSHTVTSVTSRSKFIANNSQAEGVLYGGVITFTSGLNNGYKDTISANQSNGSILLFEQAPFNVVIGDTFTAVKGCDKSRGTCQAKFNNIINFGGFPDVPGANVYVTGG